MSKKITSWALTALGLAITTAFAASILDSALASGGWDRDGGRYERDYRHDDDDRERHRTYRGDGAKAPSMTIEEAVSRLRDQGYGKIYEVEQKGEIFEVKAETAEGKRVRLYMDSWTGELLRSPHPPSRSQAAP